MKVVEIIKDNYNSLTKSEKKVADYIVSNQDRVIHNTMSDLNRLLKVGDATIIRFCKKLGFNGFTDLKISIAKDNISSAQNYFEGFALIDKIDSALKRTHQLVNEDNFNKAVTLINEKNNIYIFGKGQSGLSAKDLEILLLRNGIQSTALLDTDFQINAAAAMTEDDLLIVFSLTGRTSDLIEAIGIAKDNSATIISVTNYVLSPIAKQSDVILQSSYDEFISSPVPGRISQMYISGLLIDLYENKYNSEKMLKIKEKMLRKIINRRVDE